MIKIKSNYIYIFLLPITLFLAISCKKDNKNDVMPMIQIKSGGYYTANGAILKMNDSIIIGVKAIGTDANITNLEIKRINENNNTVTMLNEGFNTDVLEVDRIFTKGIDQQETYTITVMDKNRNTASATLLIYKDSTSTFTNIYHYKAIKLGYQNNSTYGHYLDPFTGNVYDDANVGGSEQNIHIVIYFYVSSGKPSPTLVCPAQADAEITYPNISNWTEKNATRYDYHAADFNLISPTQFDSVTTDSLLMVAYNAATSNQKCKYATQNKVVPFKTTNNKYGLLKVVTADSDDSGYMEIEIKIQK